MPPVRVPRLGPGVGVDVRTEAQVPARPAGQQPRREVERDAVDVVAQHQPEPDVAVGHERERREEVLAELAIGDPRRAGSPRSNESVSMRIGRPRRNWTL